MDRFWEGREFQPPIAEMMQLMEMVLSNADRQSWNSNHQWDPTSTYSEGYRERGTPEALAPVLAAYSQIVEPDLVGLVGDLARVPRMMGAVGDVARVADDVVPYNIVRDADGNPVKMYRIEQAGGGPGPIAADMNYPRGAAQYYGDDQYVRGFAGWREGGYLAREGYPMARTGGVWDTTGELGADASDLIRRVEVSAYRNAPPEQRQFLVDAFEKYRNGTSDAADLANDLRHIYGNDLGNIPRESGLDVLVQRGDDNRGIGREVVTFGGNQTWKDLNVYTPEELLNLIPRRR